MTKFIRRAGTSALAWLDRVLSRRVRLPFVAGVALLTLDLVLTAACILALRQIRRLRAQLTEAVATITPIEHRLAPPLIGEDQAGMRHIVQFGRDKRPTVVFTFEQKCGFCPSYWSAIRKMRTLVPRNLRFVYIDTRERVQRDYLTAHGAPGALLLATLTPETALSYQALMLPQIEVLDWQGRVQWTHAGEINSDQIDTLLSLTEKYIPSN